MKGNVERAGITTGLNADGAIGAISIGRKWIVNERFGRVQIGAVKFKSDIGERDAADAFAAAPTGPGATGLASDFFIREIMAWRFCRKEFPYRSRPVEGIALSMPWGISE